MVSSSIKLISISLLGSILCACSATTETERPNVIIILTDDQGYGDFSCYGNPILKTPALDQLHSESVSFHRFHVAAVCTPTRSELMTGLDAMNNKACMVPSGRNLMRRDIVTLPEVFRGNGYTTGLFGKWHLGDTYPDRPVDRGFQRSVWHKGWGLPSEVEFDNDYYQTRYIDQFETIQSDMYCTDLWFEKAIEWMDEQTSMGRPFFSYISLNTPHGPYYAKPEDKAIYDGLVTDSVTASFFGMIHNIDLNMKRLDQWMKKKGIWDNTILIYMTDNGGTAGVDVYNAGMRGRKGSNYEGGHRAACFFRYPAGNLNSPGMVRYPSRIADLLPTFIDLLDFEYGANIDYDGVSLKPFLFDVEKNDDRMFVVQYGGRIRPSKYFSCVVYNDWRLVGDKELYHVVQDPGQTDNVIGSHPEIASMMKLFYEDWWQKVEPGIDEMVPVIVDTKNENPVIITSNTWTEVDVDNAWRVARALGDPKGGIWNLYFEGSGNYKIELSRWPFHLDLPLSGHGPATTVGGTPMIESVAIPIAQATILVDGKATTQKKRSHTSVSIDFEIEIKEGDSRVQAWFQDDKGNALCGAYYMRISQ